MNTQYFHSIINYKRARNDINGLKDNGHWYEDQDVVKENIRDFFKAKFSGCVCQRIRLDNTDFNKITDEDNAMLVRSISEGEIKDVVWSCDSDKSSDLTTSTLG